MRLFVAAVSVAGSLGVAPALAGSIALNLDEAGQSAALQLPAMVDNCVASLMLRNDPTVCRSVSVLTMALANEVKTAHAAAAKKAAEEAASKAADDAAKKAAAP